MAVIVPIIAARCHSNCNIDLSGFGQLFLWFVLIICLVVIYHVICMFVNDTIDYFKNIYYNYKQKKQDKLMESYRIMESKFKNESKDEV